MIKQVYGLSAGFLVFCGLIMARPMGHVPFNEKDMEGMYPDSVGTYKMRAGTDKTDDQSYHMDETTYRALRPYGIVCRVMESGSSAYDVVVISGDQPDTFHNPLVCFQSQEFKVLKSEQITLHTQSRGDVPCILAVAEKGGEKQIALYTYEGPTKMVPQNADLFPDIFWSQIKTAKPQAATFFRFMTMNPSQSEGDLETFATNYLDASPVRPKGPSAIHS